MKRVFALICMFFVSFFLLLVSVSPCSASAADSGGSSGSGSYRELSRSDIDTEKTVADISGTWAKDAFNNTLESAEDIFYLAVASIGAIFSDETTLSGVKNQWNAIYANALEDPDVMRSIFYYGVDGQLYFTDEFIANTKDIVDQVSFNNGIVSVPFTQSDNFYQTALGYGMLLCTNAITSCLNGTDSRIMRIGISTGMGYSCVDLGFSISDCYTIAVFNSYSSYKSFYNSSVGLSTSSNSSNFYFCNYYDDSITYLYNSDPLIFRTTVDSSGSFPAADIKYATNTSSTDTMFSIRSNIPNVYCYGSWMLVGCGSFEAYTSVDWMQFYLNGGTGVLRGNTYYKFDNAVNPDELVNGTAIYKQLQDDYKALAGEVADGNKTLSEINDILSQEILDVANDIEQNTAVQANYLKKILDELKDISSKLTYSNVVGTVNAASNLLSLIGDALDDFFEASEGAFSLLDFVQDGLSDTMKSTFPFSLPHDLLLVFELLAVDPQTPEVKFHFDLASLGISYDYTYVADDFLKLAYLTRFFSSVGFVILLINLTNKMLKK